MTRVSVVVAFIVLLGEPGAVTASRSSPAVRPGRGYQTSPPWLVLRLNGQCYAHTWTLMVLLMSGP
jgi:hypothetical protein